ncbi:MAG: HAD-IIB family hydrolase [Gammaproteobacteria bacterium]|nr:MAG: HAD-IIB family hydrolase [Gammaproteobacteria bacterium]
MNADKQLIVISDLDGTLLDHYSYQFEAAQPALALLADNHIPLVLNSSKTAAEILEIRKALNNHQPFIAENGGGIYLPEADGYRSVAIGRPRTEFLPELYDLRDRLKLSFVGFRDMSSQQLMEHTGLTEHACRLAKQRDYTEPLLWKDSVEALQKFTDALQQQGLQVLRGGRFVHVSGQTDKGAAVRWLKRYFQEQMNRRIEIAALGDSDNDLAMLAEADYPFLIRSPVHPPPDIQLPNLKISDQFGPAGWNECICQFLESHT